MNKSLLVKGLRLLGFAAVFLLVLIAADFFLVDTDSVAALTIREMQQADDIQLAIVGSSVVRDHFNEDMITRETGLSSFSVTAPGAGFQTFAAITEELYKKNTPELLCLVLEPYNFNTAREDPEPSYKLMPWLTGLGTRVRYYAANAKIDGYWVDRALIFRDFPLFLKPSGCTSIRPAPSQRSRKGLKMCVIWAAAFSGTRRPAIFRTSSGSR